MFMDFHVAMSPIALLLDPASSVLRWALLEEGGCVSAGYSTTMGKQPLVAAQKESARSLREIPGFQQQMSLFRKAFS